MNKRKHAFLLSDTDKVNRDSYLWNMIASCVNAGEAILILMAATRTVGIEDAGILTLAFSVANMGMMIGKYGVRGFQVTDVRKEYQFGDYFYMRLLTVLGMVVGIGGYLIYQIGSRNYSGRKAVIVALIGILYTFEVIEDVFAGLYQKKGRLDVGAKLFSLRWVLSLATFALGLCLGIGTIKAALLGILAGTVSFAYGIWVTYPPFREEKMSFCKERLLKLLKQCFPLFAASFLSLYIVNASKYAIDAFLTDEVQACYGFVSMPVFVIGLLNGIIYQPILVKMSVEWNEKKFDLIKKRVGEQLGYIGVLTGVCMAGAYFLGIPVLSFLYAADLQDYRGELLVLLLGGGFLAVAGFCGAVLTIMRKTKVMMYHYAAVSVLAVLFFGVVVKRAGVWGAAVYNAVLLFLLALLFLTSTLYEYKKAKNEIKNELKK